MSEATRRPVDPDGREIIIHLSLVRKQELYLALQKQERERRAEQCEQAYQSSAGMVKQLHQQMVNREIDAVAEKLIRSAYEGGPNA